MGHLFFYFVHTMCTQQGLHIVESIYGPILSDGAPYCEGEKP